MSVAVILYYILNIISCIYGLQDDWSHHQPACAIRSYLYVISCAALSYSYLILAISRLFFTVFYTHKFLLTYRTHWLMIAANWAVSTILPIMSFFVDGGYGLEIESCLCIATSKIFVTAIHSVLTAYLIPLHIIGVIYYIIFCHARQSKRRVMPVTTTAITDAVHRNVNVPNFKREMKLMTNMLVLIGILSFGGTLYLMLTLWHATQHQPPESIRQCSGEHLRKLRRVLTIGSILSNKWFVLFETSPVKTRSTM